MSEQAASPAPAASAASLRDGGGAGVASPVTNVTVPLAAGWNPVAFQSQVLTALNGASGITGLAFWNGSSYTVGPFDQATINAGAGARRGFYVLAPAATSFSYSGTDDGQGNFVNLTAAGYNLISLCSSTDVPGSSLTATQNGQSVGFGSAVSAQFFEAGTNLAVDVSAGGVLRPGRAYWVFANTAQGPIRLSFPGSPTPSPSPGSTASLVRIDVTGIQVGGSVAPGQSVQLTATGVFSDSSTRNLTSEVTWTSSNASTVSITNLGLATGGAIVGGAAITATLGSVSTSTAVLVQQPTAPPVLPSPSPTPFQPILVACNANAVPNSLTVYTLLTNGNVAPLRTVQGAATTMSRALNPSVDPTTGEIYVASYNSNSVLVFAYNASGNVAPVRTIAGAATGLSSPTSVAVDPANDCIYVTCEGGGNSVRTFARNATGNVAPLRAITGGVLNFPSQVVVDNTNNELVVANAGNRISSYARTATGAAAPLRSITGAATNLSDSRGVAVDASHNEILVTNRTSNSITVYARTATGNIAPIRTLTGGATLINNPWSLAYNASRDEVNVGGIANQILVFDRAAGGNTAPLRTVTGAATGLNQPLGVGILP